MLVAKKTISEIQDCAAFAFKEFHDLLRLVRLDADFLKRCSKVFEKSIEVSVVQPLLPHLRMGGSNIFACIYDASAKQHGKKHTLSCHQMSLIAMLEERTETFIGQDSSIEGSVAAHTVCFPPMRS